MKRARIGETELQLSDPVRGTPHWIGQGELIEQLLACWTLVTNDDLPLCPRVVGRPGMGKTTLAQAAGSKLGAKVFIFQCTMDTRPEDLLITPVIADNGRIAYHASPLVTAMIEGGVAILDEANRMSEKSWASLAPLLDDRRYVESIIAGLRVEAHRDFRCCVTMNNDASTYEVPDYIISRLQPLIEIDFPTREDERAILKYNVNFAPEDLLEITTEFLQEAHGHRLGYSTRDGINIMRYAMKLEHAKLASNRTTAFRMAMEAILGAEADNFEARAEGQFFPGLQTSFESLFPEESDEDEEEEEEDRR